MNTQDLVIKVAEETVGTDSDYLTKGDVDKIVRAAFETIGQSLQNGEEVSIHGFGKFESKHQGAKTGTSPGSGEPWSTPAKNVPKFKAAAALKDRVA